MEHFAIKSKKDPLICLCNKIPLSKILEAIEVGAKTTDELYDLCGAGVGPCGGSCRKITGPMIQDHLKSIAKKTGK